MTTGTRLPDTVKEIQLKALEKQKQKEEGKKKAKGIETILIRCKEKCICTNEECCAKN